MRLILALILFSSSLTLLAQDLPKKMAKKICKCSEKKNITKIEDMDPCFEKVVMDNIKGLYKYYKVETLDEIDFDGLGAEIGTYLIKDCDYLAEYLTNENNKLSDDFVIKENLDCTILKNGDFYYYQENFETKKNDTTYVTIKEDMFLERMNNGKTYSKLKVEWLDECKFELTFENSNDPVKNAFSKTGDKYLYEVIDSTTNYFTIKLNWNGQDYKFDLFKSEE